MILSRIAQFILFAGLTLLIRLPATFSLFLVLLMINIISDCLGAYGGGLQLPLLRRLLPEEALDEAMGFSNGYTKRWCKSFFKVLVPGPLFY
ncbi:hypothetical protein [uncultured Enterococcus sp.]|uniref:hypothetical protein n=1 Tax=uncultured Enterococcus sp. TaxID=167972 RepID=UPI002AA81101|nr:hypothetical protein [uncultured Enterococcus sp.]